MFDCLRVECLTVKNADAVEILRVFEEQGIYCQIYLDDKLIIDTFSEITTADSAASDL